MSRNAGDETLTGGRVRDKEVDMTEIELANKLVSIYWSAQAEKERAVQHYTEQGRQAGAYPEKVSQIIQRSMEDIEHDMRAKLATVAIEYIHSNIE